MEMKPSTSGRRIRSCMPIQAPKEKPAIHTPRESGMQRLDPVERRRGVGKLADAVVEIALARPTPRKLKRRQVKPRSWNM